MLLVVISIWLATIAAAENVPRYYKVKEITATRVIFGPVEDREWKSPRNEIQLKFRYQLRISTRKSIQKLGKHRIKGNERIFDNYDEIIDRVLVGSIPLHRKTLSRLINDYKVTRVINLLAPYEYEEIQDRYEEFELNELQLPTQDHFEPSVDDLEAGVEFIKHNMARNEGTFIHCYGGHGRSAAVVFALLVDLYQCTSLYDLQKMMLNARYNIRKTLYEQPNIIAFAKRRPGRSQVDPRPDEDLLGLGYNYY